MKWILLWYVIAGIVTAGFYAWDKRMARRDGWRIPERRLHVLELVGGVIGALVAQQLFRHKRRKWKFFLVTWTIALLHVVAWAAWLWWNARSA